MVGPGLRDFLGHVKFIAKTETVLGPLGWLVILEIRTTYWRELFHLAMKKKKKDPHVNRYIKVKCTLGYIKCLLISTVAYVHSDL